MIDFLPDTNRNDSPQGAQEAQGVQFPGVDDKPAGTKSPTCAAPGRGTAKENLAAREHQLQRLGLRVCGGEDDTIMASMRRDNG
jgi:hypothetical protein